jgi:hypothetical protein
MSKQRPPNDVLIAIMNSHKDWAILHEQLWYRIPEEKTPQLNLFLRDRKPYGRGK